MIVRASQGSDGFRLLADECRDRRKHPDGSRVVMRILGYHSHEQQRGRVRRLLFQNDLQIPLCLGIALELPEVGSEVTSQRNVGWLELERTPKNCVGLLELLLYGKNCAKTAQNLGVARRQLRSLTQFQFGSAQVAALRQLQSLIRVFLRRALSERS